MNGFIGANIKSLDHFISPTLVEDKPDTVIIYIGSNDITHNTIDQIEVKDTANRIINIEKRCVLGRQRSDNISIFIKKEFKLTRIVRQVNDLLGDECKSNNFRFVSNY